MPADNCLGCASPLWFGPRPFCDDCARSLPVDLPGIPDWRGRRAEATQQRNCERVAALNERAARWLAEHAQEVTVHEVCAAQSEEPVLRYVVPTVPSLYRKEPPA